MERREEFEDGFGVEPEAEKPGEEGVEPEAQEDPEEQEPSEPTVADSETSEDEVQKPKVKKRDPAQTRINQIMREKFRAEDEAQKLREENQKLQQMVSFSTKAAMDQYEESAYQRLEKARNLKAAALESGDLEAQVNADTELALAATEVNNLNRVKVQQNLQQQNYQEPPYIPPEVLNQQEATRWVEMNDWFNPNSVNYDEDLAKATQVAANMLDAYCYRTGQPHKIMSRDYFEELDNYVSNIQAQSGYHNQRRDLPMRAAKTNVSPVRSGAVAETNTRQQYKLSAEEKDMARRLGIDEKTMMQSVIRDMQQNPNRRKGRIY